MKDNKKLVVDGVGGDNAPAANVAGCISAIKLLPKDTSIILVGPEEELSAELAKFKSTHLRKEERLIIMHAPDKILANDLPTVAIKNKPFSSIMVGLKLVERKEADAFISPGSTGAIVAGSILTLGRIPGILKPALATLMPTKDGNSVLFLDVGAGVDCRPENLVQFAIMGSLYTTHILKIPKPKVGILSIGEEDIKGNRLTTLAFERLEKEESIIFCGNIEGNDILSGKVDVVVTDGFVGNIILKFAESLGEHLLHLLKKELKKSTPLLLKLNLALLKSVWKKLKKKVDYVAYGGAPLLGIRGTCVICHGRSNSEAIKNAILSAYKLTSSPFEYILEEKLCKKE